MEADKVSRPPYPAGYTPIGDIVQGGRRPPKSGGAIGGHHRRLPKCGPQLGLWGRSPWLPSSWHEKSHLDRSRPSVAKELGRVPDHLVGKRRIPVHSFQHGIAVPHQLPDLLSQRLPVSLRQ